MDILKSNNLRNNRYNYISAGMFGIGGLFYGLRISLRQTYKIIFLRSFACVFLGTLFGHAVGDSIDPNGKPGSLLFDDIMPNIIVIEE